MFVIKYNRETMYYELYKAWLTVGNPLDVMAKLKSGLAEGKLTEDQTSDLIIRFAETDGLKRAKKILRDEKRNAFLRKVLGH